MVTKKLGLMMLVALVLINFCFSQSIEKLALIPTGGYEQGHWLYDHAYNVSKAAFLTNTDLVRDNFVIYTGSMETDSIIKACNDLDIKYVLYPFMSWQTEPFQLKMKDSGILWFCPFPNSDYEVKPLAFDSLQMYRICSAVADSNDQSIMGWGNTLEFFDSYYEIGAINNVSSFVLGVIFGKFMRHKKYIRSYGLEGSDDQVRASMRHSAGMPWTPQTGFGRPKLDPEELVTPVEWLNFFGNLRGNLVLLEWGTQSEDFNLGFRLYRQKNNEERQKVGFVSSCCGTTTLPQNYSFEDTLKEFGEYQYFLTEVDRDGNEKYHPNIVKINYFGKPPGKDFLKKGLAAKPEKYELYQNYPNPFNPQTHINFDLPVESRVRLKIYNFNGKLVEEIFNGCLFLGYHEKIWRPQENVSSGVYLLIMEAGNFRKTISITYLK